MKDLLVYVADADALAFMKAILERPPALGIRPISFDIERHPMRDAGMVQSGAELARMKKGRYHKALLMWDHHGSGRDHRQTPDVVSHEIQSKLDSFTWRENSAATVLVPELEQWLWFCENAMIAHLRITVTQLAEWQNEHARKQGLTAEVAKSDQPKECFEYIMRRKLKRTISPRDFEEIAKRASITSLAGCRSFSVIAQTLRSWFPA